MVPVFGLFPLKAILSKHFADAVRAVPLPDFWLSGLKTGIVSEALSFGYLSVTDAQG
jgi:hypothetical protein